MSEFPNSALVLAQNQLSAFSSLDNFWNLFDSAFGKEYNRTIAEKMRSQWQSGDFRQLPQIEVIDSKILGNINGAYATSTNTIYLSDRFLANAIPEAVTSVLLEEIGHFIDAQINQQDTPGDEGEIFSALVRGENLTTQSLTKIYAENDWSTITLNGQTIAIEKSDPDVLNFNITFNDPLGKFSAYYSAIKSNILAAGANWDNYITGNASLEILVNFSNPNPTATGRSLASSFVYNNGTLSVYEPGAISEIRTGVDPNGATPDIEFNFNPDYLVNELWFDPDPVARTTTVPINKTDAVSLLLHEFGHVFGFNAWKDNFDATLSGNYQSTFDEKIVFDGSNFFFVGKQATSVYGSPVPLTFGNITHVGNDASRPGVNLVGDLMNGVIFYRGVRYNISPLDVAILKDAGVPIVDVPIVSLTSANQTIVEGNSSIQNATYTVNLSQTSNQTVIVQYFTANVTATAGSDYTSTIGTITFNPGETSKVINIPILNDFINEEDETFILQLISPANAILGTSNTVTTTITDTLTASVTTTLPTNVENLTLTGTSQINGTGNAGHNILKGNSANNKLIGNAGNDTLDGGAGNDTLDGGVGNDLMIGGVGNDIYYVDSSNDQIIELANEGTDNVFAGVSWVLSDALENLTLTSTDAINGTGNALNNSITGNNANNKLLGGDGDDTLKGEGGNDILDGGAGNDTLTGGSGNDILIGGAGNDSYYVDSSNDQIIELVNEGTDTVRTTVNWTLGDNVENLVLTGTSAINGTGNALKNTITGNTADNQLSGGDNDDNLIGDAGNDTLDGGAGNDTLDGGVGNDLMVGGAGNDIYYVDNSNDKIIELANEGTDTVRVGFSYTLGDNLENLVLTGSNAVDGTGNALKNTITGNAANNNLFGGDNDDTLNGGDGNDTLNGGNGNDTLVGGNGNDTLVGGVGSDRLTGGAGSDKFVFSSLGEGIDTITDFSSTDDFLVVQTLLTNLSYTGTNPIADGYIRSIQSGSNTLIQIDIDGWNGNSIFSTLATVNNFIASNFSLNNVIF
ncbi:Calx-beta domain-containing protein [Nostoc sp. FACHB-280]|uniref:Calx-beta domain-containing protein n=1 Tax=Nostoc sp. FACHB-280 TaxID=2692839 RepID=UPI00168B290C|nr:Calx-beta domain-containing protein [Nostoc sp. FACHB-280]MBD2494355.1 hypothetical protein [Nostoc sp. FACHB-280]